MSTAFPNRWARHARAVHSRPVPGGYRPESARENERNEVHIERDGGTLVCRQVVGVLARRLVCRVAAGRRCAPATVRLMKFGSRIDLYLPLRSTLHVATGDRVRGGETVVATW